MSIKNLDITYGFNGEPSTASVSFAKKSKRCASQTNHKKIGGYSQSISTGIEQIDSLIGDFVVSRIQESKESGFETITYEIVDKQAKRLESIPVLVRGITAPPTEDSFKWRGLLYKSAEIYTSNPKIGEKGLSLPVYKDGIATIGRTFSIVTASYSKYNNDLKIWENENIAYYYSGGTIQHQSQEAPISQEFKDSLEDAMRNPSIQYGYYLKDFYDLLSLCGYTTSGFPTDNKFMILDFGGNLKDCISSIASMFGLYWMCRGNKITFYSSSELEALDITNFNDSDDSSILSSSYSEEIIGKSNVGVVVGTTNNDLRDNASSGSSGRTKTINFRLIEYEKVFGQSVNFLKAFYSYFKFSGSETIFDKIIFLRMLAAAISGENIDNEFLNKFYGPERIKKSEPESLTKIESDPDKRQELLNNHTVLKTKTALYPLKDQNLQQPPLPSTKPIFGILKSACEAAFVTYISKPVSEWTANNYSPIPKEGMSISGAYKGDTLIKDIPSLAPIFQMYQEINNLEDQKLSSLYKTTITAGEDSESVLDPDEAFYFVGIADILSMLEEKDSFEESQKDVKNASDEGRGGVLDLGQFYKYLATSQDERNKIQKMFDSSIALFNKCVTKAKKQINTTASKIDADQSSSSNNENNQDLSVYASEFKSFTIRAEIPELSSVSIAKYEGNVGEAEYIDSNFSKINRPSFRSKSSSVTYFGLVEANEDPLLTSISITFSGGSVETTISYSNKEFLSESDSVIMAGYNASKSHNVRRQLNPRQKNFLGIR